MLLLTKYIYFREGWGGWFMKITHTFVAFFTMTITGACTMIPNLDVPDIQIAPKKTEVYSGGTQKSALYTMLDTSHKYFLAHFSRIPTIPNLSTSPVLHNMNNLLLKYILYGHTNRTGKINSVSSCAQ